MKWRRKPLVLLVGVYDSKADADTPPVLADFSGGGH
jgi:hypothetical protein